MSVAIILYREMLEITMIIVVALATIENKSLRVNSVLIGGSLGTIFSSIIACFAAKISYMFEGQGQELLNASILILASLMILLTLSWTSAQGKSFKSKLQGLQQEGTHKFSLMQLISASAIIALAVTREGSEIILFLYGATANTSMHAPKFIAEILIGGVLGAITGVLLYYGLLKFSRKYLFKLINLMMMFLAASMAAKASNFLIAGEFIDASDEPIWDSSAILSLESGFGKFMNLMLGYTDRPSFTELVVYIIVASIGGYIIKRGARNSHNNAVS